MLLFISSLLKASPPEHLIENFNLALTQYTAALHCIVPVFIYMVKCRQSVFWNVIFNITLSIDICVNGSAWSLNTILLKNKFYIETKLNRDLRDDLMKLFSDHVAEKHVSTLLRECKSCEELQKILITTFWVELNANTFIQVFVFFSALLKKAHSMPFQVKPSTMESVVKGLYTLRPGKMLFPEVFWL